MCTTLVSILDTTGPPECHRGSTGDPPATGESFATKRSNVEKPEATGTALFEE